MTCYHHQMRTIVDLTQAQVGRLERIAARDKISRAEAVRRAIDVAYPEDDRTASVEAIRRRAFGSWLGSNIDAEAYVNELRDEWER